VTDFDLLLIGFGSVNRRFAALLEERAGWLAREGIDARIVGIATGRGGAAWAPAGIDGRKAIEAVESARSLAAVNDPRTGAPPRDGIELIARAATSRQSGRIQVLVEATPLDIQEARPAITYIRAAFDAGLHVISANKGPVALSYRALQEAAGRRGVRYFFEAAVMDGIPVFNLVQETMPAVRVTGFRGVINSTTNYVITMLEAGGEFDEALAEMQRQGVAEADPSLDVDGWDAAAKTAALMNVLMDAQVTPRDIERTGIRALTGAQVRTAMTRGRRVRLVSTAWLEGTRPKGRVAPEELPVDEPLALLRGMSNAIFLETDLLGRVGITELDGGLTQTAYALLSDLIRLRRSL